MGMDECPRNKQKAKKKGTLTYDRGETSEPVDDQVADCAESEQDIDENMLTGAMRLLDLFKNVLPTSSKEVILRKLSQKIKTTKGSDTKDKMNSHRKKCVKPPGDVKLIENAEEKLKGTGIKSIKNTESTVTSGSGNEADKSACPKTSTKCKHTSKGVKGKINGKSKDVYDYEFLRREPKRSKHRQKKRCEIKTKQNCANPVLNRKSTKHIKTVKEIMQVLLKPCEIHMKIQSIQKLKRNKTLLSTFLSEKRKLGKQRIPILKRKADALKLSKQFDSQMEGTGSLNNDGVLTAVDATPKSNSKQDIDQSSIYPEFTLPDMTNKAVDHHSSVSLMDKEKACDLIGAFQSCSEPKQNSNIPLDTSAAGILGIPEATRDIIREFINEYEISSVKRQGEGDINMTSYFDVFPNKSQPCTAFEVPRTNRSEQLPPNSVTSYLEEFQTSINSSNDTPEIKSLKVTLENDVVLDNCPADLIGNTSGNFLDPGLQQHFQFLANDNDVTTGTQTFEQNSTSTIVHDRSAFLSQSSFVKSPFEDQVWIPYCPMDVCQYTESKIPEENDLGHAHFDGSFENIQTSSDAAALTNKNDNSLSSEKYHNSSSFLCNQNPNPNPTDENLKKLLYMMCLQALSKQ